MTDKVTTDRRSVLKTAGVLGGASVLGGIGTGSALASHEDGGTAVRVNQVGYATDAQKLANVTSEMADVSSLSSFEVVDVDSGSTVSSGTLGAEMTDSGWSNLDGPASGHTVKRADFTDVTTAGTYKVVVGNHESRPFSIGEPGDVYGDLLADVGRLYTLKRANADIQDPQTGLDIGPGHMQDANAVIRRPASGASDFLNDHSAGDTIDVTGGWYDAGDYGKYVITHAVTAAQMMLAYERNPDAFSMGQFDIPDSLNDPNVGQMPDVLAEVKYGMQFLSKMQRPDGALFFKLAKAGPNQSFPKMTAAPTDITATRYVLGLSSAGTAMGVGAFAMAARVFADHDQAFADKMLQQAKDGFQWLQNNSSLVWEKSAHQDSASGAYGRGDSDSAERYWAAAELLRTTGNSTYDTYIQNNVSSELNGGRSPIDWNDTSSLGHYAYAKSNGQSTNTAKTTMGKAIYVTERYNPAKTGNDPYTTGVYDFYWGGVKSGLSRAMQGMWGVDVAAQSYIGPNKSPAEWIMEPLHRALGRSATGYSYVTSHGEKSVQNPHDRIIQSQSNVDIIPGMLIGGPHNNLWDSSGKPTYNSSLVDHVTQDTPPAMSFLDAHDAYVVSEWAINYTAPLLATLAEIPGMTASDDGGTTGPDGVNDPDNDGDYEDFNDTGDIDFDDVVEYNNRRRDDSVSMDPQYFDYNGNSEAGDFDDLVRLFKETQ